MRAPAGRDGRAARWVVVCAGKAGCYGARPVSAPEPIVVQTHAMAHGGEAVGRQVEPDPGDDARVWFVAGAMPGERVAVAPTREARRWRRGRVLRVLQACPDRVSAPCDLAGRCGGCTWQHVAPVRQTALRREVVADQLRSVRPLGLEVQVGYAAREALGYRRRVKLHYRHGPAGLILGFRRAQAHELVDVPACPVLEPALARACARVRDLAPHLPAQGNVLGLCDGRRVVLGLPGVAPSPARLAAAEAILDQTLVGVVFRGGRRRGHVGHDRLLLDAEDDLPGIPVTPFVFTQAQSAGNRALVGHVVAQAACDGRDVLELFCGAGNFTRALARRARRLWAVDEDREAIATLRETIRRHRLRVHARRGRADRTLRRWLEDGRRAQVVVLDPPRAGLGLDVARDLARLRPERVVYVSCDPATLARDLAPLVAGGLRLAAVHTFDLMPHTAHVETVATLVAS